MKSIFLHILSVFALFFYACSSEEDDGDGMIREPSVPGNIYGVITDKSTAEPMRATGVELYYYDALLQKTVTYDDGHYEFNDLKADTYYLKVVAEGYEDVTFKIKVEAGRTARADMQLTETHIGMTVRTLNITDIIGNKATLNGSYSYQSSGPSECGFYYAAHDNPLDNGTRITGTQKKDSFSVSINDLKKGTYHVIAYATNSKGTAYGEERTFQISGAPAVTTLAATNVTENTATLNAKIEYAGDPAYTERGFVYSRAFQNPTIDDPAEVTIKRVVAGTSTEYSANIVGLTTNNIYYVRAYITNGNDIVYGESICFSDSVITLQDSKIMVQKNDISTGVSWNEARLLCASSTVGFCSNWRLPTSREHKEVLYSNMDALNMSQSIYWASETNGSYNYVFSYSSGSSGYTTNTAPLHVRCVRSLAQ